MSFSKSFVYCDSWATFVHCLHSLVFPSHSFLSLTCYHIYRHEAHHNGYPRLLTGGARCCCYRKYVSTGNRSVLTERQYDWNGAKKFSNPSNTNNDCSADQKAGFDWSDLKTGQFDSYKGFDFSGFDCAAPNGTLETRSIKRRTGSNVSLRQCSK